jgi:hypothetical protein
MTKTEWVHRCAKRLTALSDRTWNWALRDAATLADYQAEANGESAIAWATPESVADQYVAEEDDEGGAG